MDFIKIKDKRERYGGTDCTTHRNTADQIAPNTGTTGMDYTKHSDKGCRLHHTQGHGGGLHQTQGIRVQTTPITGTPRYGLHEMQKQSAIRSLI